MTTLDITREQFASFRTAYLSLANSDRLTSCDILLNNLIRGLPATRGFTAITNSTKLANGAKPFEAFERTRDELRGALKYRPQAINQRFGGAFTDHQLDCLRMW